MRVDTVGSVGYIDDEAPVELPAQLNGHRIRQTIPLIFR